ncbi:hypothetical protein [Streptomyces katrae]|uniref:Uncharacterized protein n=1 Tax=Streptomyces katrae TaxID=68223 RepID=A0A0F4JN84_9ACTN|nr:hypothetical protein [Streptomyces katrae]KJY35650.1 hypothetical protein VR44_09540 [Streptomyces katrae]
MNAVRTAGRRVPARQPLRGPRRGVRPRPAPPLTALLRRRAAWGLALTRARALTAPKRTV